MGNQKEDFTSIESLGEYTHEENTDVNRQLGLGSKPSSQSEAGASEEEESEAPPFSSDDPPEELPQGEDSASEWGGTSSEDDNPPPLETQSEDSSSNFSLGSTETENDPSESGDSFGSSDEASGDAFSSSDNQEGLGFSEDSSPSELPSEDPAPGETSDPFASFSSGDESVDPSFSTTPEESPEFPGDSLGSSNDASVDSDTSSAERISSESPETASNFSSSNYDQGPLTTNTSSVHQPPETFQDLKDFAQNITYGKVDVGGNPPFSIILKDIKYKEDRDDILRIMREHGLVLEQNEEMVKNALNNGQILISQISEFSAIYLAHKFRRFDLEILMGLSDEIHPPKTYKNPRGLVSKSTLKQNKSLTMDLRDLPLDINSILLSTTPQLEGRQIAKYLGPVAVYRILEEDDFLPPTQVSRDQSPLGHSQLESSLEGDSGMDMETGSWDKRRSQAQERGPQVSPPSLGQIYEVLANELRYEALKLRGNAIVGITYQLTPLVPARERSYKAQYQLTCTGNVVWVM